MKKELIKPKFKITRQHVEGAIAMLLVCVLTVSAISISTRGGWPFGAVFEGYEEAQEKTIAISPNSIDAVKDYAGQAFTLTGLPEGEHANIKPEHVVLGGYFDGLTVQKVEVSEANLVVTVAAGNAHENSAAVDWEDYNGGNGIIAVSPAAFSDKSFYYQGETVVLYPRLISETEAIAQKDDLTVSQEITLTLENDSFAGTMTADDLEISGGFDQVKAEKFRHEGQKLIFTLNGKADGEFGGAHFTVPGDKLSKKLDVSFSSGIGRVPMAVQSGPLYINSPEPQKLRIFIDYDAFTDDVNLSMITFGGVMSAFEVAGFERINAKTVELTLKGGPSAAGTGTVRFDSAAVLSGRSGRTAEITAASDNVASDSVATALTAGRNNVEAIRTSGAGVAVSALYFLCSKAWAYGTAEIRKTETTGSFFSTLGLSSVQAETQKMLQEISGKLDKMSAEISVNNQVLHNRINALEYDLSATVIQNSTLNSIDKMYRDFRSKTKGNISQGAFDDWCYNNLRYTSSGSNPAKNYLDTLGLLLDELNPYGSGNALKKTSLFRQYERTCKSHVPFEHNTFMSVTSYAWDWDAAFANYLMLATTIVDYNRDKNPELTDVNLENLLDDFASLSNNTRITFENIKKYIITQPYAKSYEQLLVDPGKDIYYVVRQDGTAHIISSPSQLSGTAHSRRDSKDSYYSPAASSGTITAGAFYARVNNGNNGAAAYRYDYLAVNYKKDYNGISFKSEFAENKATVTPPYKVNAFLQNLQVTVPGKNLNNIFADYLISYDDLQSRNIKKNWTRKFDWLYGAHTDFFKKSMSVYYNDRTLMIDAVSAPSGTLSYQSVTCEDGLYKTKQSVKSGDVIMVLLCPK
ncbi:MAG: hypothetical protein FWG69_03030 [Oscillospiraceae bacterium]|nr:hypothetical protein [Oscillospiraceae bacterium]